MKKVHFASCYRELGSIFTINRHITGRQRQGQSRHMAKLLVWLQRPDRTILEIDYKKTGKETKQEDDDNEDDDDDDENESTLHESKRYLFKLK